MTCGHVITAAGRPSTLMLMRIADRDHLLHEAALAGRRTLQRLQVLQFGSSGDRLHSECIPTSSTSAASSLGPPQWVSCLNDMYDQAHQALQPSLQVTKQRMHVEARDQGLHTAVLMGGGRRFT